ncbi:cupin fold metalloprotein, WbuC family [Pectobacterium polaris]|nr:WbuC family cupin fold metalloprotein [Pectobacterium polaris]MCU1788932.1 cupin fold metalloprotein, WbuC family [Pectobacterium polaris]PWD59411.1 cupin fold metalloprotein, WbuC family [Pectobacterium polaris]GKV82497.1 hypothetical protein PEC106664_32710 [Pectobacterium carotovorum subsp. carotovorum]
MRQINKELIYSLYQQASKSDRKRSHYLLHSSHQDKVQRLLIALVKGSYVEPHFHELEHQWEMFTVIEGCVEICIYDAQGGVIKKITAGEGAESAIIEFNPYDIHSLKCVSDRALILEVKEGPFLIEYAKAYPSWSNV